MLPFADLPHLPPTKFGEALRHLEPRPQAAALADIILGGQDGLVNTLGVILGVAAASSDLRIVIAGGFAATFAESISMGAVAYTSTLAEHDHYRAELERERREIRDMPEAEQQEVRDIFAGWGFSGDLLERAVSQVIEDEEAWVDVMMRNEIKLAPIEDKSALRNAWMALPSSPPRLATRPTPKTSRTMTSTIISSGAPISIDSCSSSSAMAGRV